MLLRKDSIIFNHSWVSSCTMGILKSQWLHPTDPTRCLFIAQSKNSLFSNPCPYNPIFNYYICLLYNTFIYIHDIWIPIYIYILLNKFVYISFHILSPSQYIHIHIYHILVDITMSGAWSSRNKFGGAHWFSFPDIIFPGYPPTILRPTRFLCLNLLGDAACHARLRRPGLLRSHWLNSVWCIADQCQAGQKKWWRTIQTKAAIFWGFYCMSYAAFASMYR
jgi:hypothetical protein